MPGHHEGDLIKGSTVSNSAVGTVVERTSGYVTLLHLPDGYAATKVAEAVIEQMSALPPWFAKTLTWDRGREMAKHAEITEPPGSRSTSQTPTAPSSDPPTRTPTGCSASTCQRHRPLHPLTSSPAEHRRRTQRPAPQTTPIPDPTGGIH